MVALIALVCIIAGGYFIYEKWFGKTVITLINFRDFQYAELKEVVKDLNVELKRVKFDKDNLISLTDESIVFLRCMGLRVVPEMKKLLKEASDSGVKITTFSPGSNVADIPNIGDEAANKLRLYKTNGGKRNLKNLFLYTRKNIDKKIVNDNIDEPEDIPGDQFFYLGDQEYFNSYKEYLEFYKKRGLYKKGAPKVALFSTIIGPRTIKRGHVDEMIKGLEKKGFNVFPVCAWKKRFEFLKEIEPDVAVVMAFFRFTSEQKKLIKYLKDKKIPMLCPVMVHEPVEKWMKSQNGIMGGMLTHSIVTPETDGGIEPMAFAAQFKNEEGLYLYGALKKRIKRICTRVENWIKLKRKANSKKKIAIVYYKGPGKNAMVAGGMEVVPSLYKLLKELKKRGYNTGILPEDEQAFYEIIQQKGPVIGSYAEGSMAEYMKNGDPHLLPVQEYNNWLDKDLELDLKAELIKQQGAPPGNYMGVVRGEKRYLAITRVKFGNITLLPQPMPGGGKDTSKLVHGVKKAPSHNYIAAYLWIKNGLKADALMHFGTHGSLEFTPWKQVALSDYDWPDLLIGDIPHPYLYIINNIGEAVLAKRRTAAVLVSHLTPPFTESDLYGDLAKLDDKVHAWMEAGDPLLKRSIENKIRTMVKAMDMNKDLQIKDEDMRGNEFIERVHDYLHKLESAKITQGLYTVGKGYSSKDLEDTARLMVIDPLSVSIARLRIAKGLERATVFDNPHNFSEKYRKPAEKMIEKMISGEKSAEEYISKEDMERVKRYDMYLENKRKKKKRMMSMMMSGAKPGGMMGMMSSMMKGPPPGIITEAVVADLKLCLNPETLKAELKGSGYERVAELSRRASLFKRFGKMKGGKGTDKWSTIFFELLGKKGNSGLLKKSEDLIKVAEKRALGKEKEYVSLVKGVYDNLKAVNIYRGYLKESPVREIEAMATVLEGGYIEPSPGADPIKNPRSIPTGRNLYAIDAEATPTEEAWETGKMLADKIIAASIKDKGEAPKKVAFTLWGGEFIRDKGTTIAEILWMLGVEPVRDRRGRVFDVKLVPSEKLKRARIDVLVQTSGQFRDVAASRIDLINKAVRLAAESRDEGYTNNVWQGSLNAEAVMKKRGITPEKARYFATARVFGGINGNYGTNIMDKVEASDTWEKDSKIAKQYMKNMGAVYMKDSWSEFLPGMFEAAVQNTDTVIQPRSSNQYGPLTLDHYYEFMGGICATVRTVTGKDPAAYFSDLRNNSSVRIESLKDAVWTEARTTLFNPRYIKALIRGGASSAEKFAETFRNTFAWNALKPADIDSEIWDEINRVYIDDKHKLELKKFFKRENPYALQEMTSVMLETARKGYWKPSKEVLVKIANLHVALVKEFKAGCSGFVCNNSKVRDMVAELVDSKELKDYRKSIDEARVKKADSREKEGMKLEKEKKPGEEPLIKIDSRMVIIIVSVLLAALILMGLIRKKRD